MSDERSDSFPVELVLPLTTASNGRNPNAHAVDLESLEVFARQQAPRVHHLLHRILGPRDDLQDLVQIVFVELMRSLPRFRGESQLSTFVGGITVRVARRALRPSAWVRYRAQAPLEPAATTPSADAQLVAREQLRRVHSALGRIKPKKRIAFALWAFEGMNPNEIAELTGASVAAIRSRIFYAQKELRAMAARDPWLADLIGDDDE